MRRKAPQGSSGSSNNLAIWGVVAAVALIAAVAYFITRPAAPVQESPTAEVSDVVGEVDISAEVSAGAQNPTEDLPQTNPFEASTNPFDSYKNPFE